MFKEKLRAERSRSSEGRLLHSLVLFRIILVLALQCVTLLARVIAASHTVLAALRRAAGVGIGCGMERRCEWLWVESAGAARLRRVACVVESVWMRHDVSLLPQNPHCRVSVLKVLFTD